MEGSYFKQNTKLSTDVTLNETDNFAGHIVIDEAVY